MGNGGGVHVRQAAAGQARFQSIQTVRRDIKRIQAPGAAHARADGQGLATCTCAKIHHHLAALGVKQQGQQLRAFILHLDGTARERIQLGQRRLVVNAQAPGRIWRGAGLDAGLGQLLLHVGTLVLEGIDAQIQRGALRQAFHQWPEAVAQLVLEGLHQPFGQVVTVALHQVIDRDRIALVQPVLFLVGQCALEEVARAVKPQDGQTALLGSRARGRHVVEQELLAQHGVDRFGQGGPLAGAQAPVIAEES
ncbi:hypothetical protein D3C71_1380520 [compost metagenome]